MRTQHFLVVLCLMVSNPMLATRYHVNASATGSATGLTWANAFTDVQAALSIVIPGDEIWVAAGQYKTTTSTDRTVSFMLRNSVNLYGGFAGTETDLSQRDIALNPTTLNGDIGQLGDGSDNTHNIITANNIATTIVVDGFSIINGRSTGSFNGGALNLTNSLSGEIVLRNCSLFNNYASNYGGAIYLAAVRLRIENCTFFGNSTGSGGNGGAIYNGNNNGGAATLILRDCIFKSNVARQGACLYNSLQYQLLDIDRCIFTNNSSPNSIIHVGDLVSAVLSNSLIVGNTVNDFSGNVLYVNSTTTGEFFSLINCTIAHNFNLYANTIQDDIVRFEDNDHQMANCIIYGNTIHDGSQVNSVAAVSNSIIEGGYPSGTSILDTDPVFLDPYTGVPANFDCTVYDYRLDASSPGINAGSNGDVPVGADLDLAGAPRLQGGVVDIGCYESDQTVAIGTAIAAPPGWRFDMEHGELVVPDADASKNALVTIHGINGQVHARILLQRTRTALDLEPGMYVVSWAGHAALAFVVH